MMPGSKLNILKNLAFIFAAAMKITENHVGHLGYRMCGLRETLDLKDRSVYILNLLRADIMELPKHAASAYGEAFKMLMNSDYNSICMISLYGIYIYLRS